MSNACPSRFTAAAGTRLAGTYYVDYSHFSSSTKGFYSLKAFFIPRNMAGSCFRTLSNIPHCCLLKKFGHFSNSNVADDSLKSARGHRLGALLPHQLAWSHKSPSNSEIKSFRNYFFFFRKPISKKEKNNGFLYRIFLSFQTSNKFFFVQKAIFILQVDKFFCFTHLYAT